MSLIMILHTSEYVNKMIHQRTTILKRKNKNPQNQHEFLTIVLVYPRPMGGSTDNLSVRIRMTQWPLLLHLALVPIFDRLFELLYCAYEPRIFVKESYFRVP